MKEIQVDKTQSILIYLKDERLILKTEEYTGYVQTSGPTDAWGVALLRNETKYKHIGTGGKRSNWIGGRQCGNESKCSMKS